MQVTDVGVEGSDPEMLVRVLSYIAQLGFIECKGKTEACLEMSTNFWTHWNIGLAGIFLILS